MSSASIGTNWAGNVRYSARRLHEPTSIDDLRRLLPRLRHARVLGSRHSFNDIADTHGDLVSLARLPRVVRIDPARQHVTIDGGARYGDVCGTLDQAGLAFHALASLAHISVAGAITTATHGSGDRLQSLAAAVVGLELVTAAGDVVAIDLTSEDDLLRGATVSLGGLGAVASVTLAVEPSYRMRQDVYEHLPATSFRDHFAAITSSCDSASFFTTWASRRGFPQVWLKRRVAAPDDFSAPVDLFGASRAVRQLHPIPGFPAEACTAQLGVPGPWYERAPHFRFEDTPSSGAELQSEYYIDRTDAPAAAAALFRLGDVISQLVQTSEIRTVAAEDMWMSPTYQRPSATIHFTWVPDGSRVRSVLPHVEAALAPFLPRPHWAKLSTMSAASTRASYARWPAFSELLRQFDPNGVFRNPFLERLLYS